MSSRSKTSKSYAAGVSIEFSETLPRGGVMRRGLLSTVDDSDIYAFVVPASSCWPSPTVEDARASRRHGYTINGHSGTTLTDAMLQWYGIESSEDPPMVLSPDFTEALLGLPADWTNLDDASACDALETPSLQIKLF
jgi:hypothetical protein